MLKLEAKLQYEDYSILMVTIMATPTRTTRTRHERRLTTLTEVEFTVHSAQRENRDSSMGSVIFCHKLYTATYQRIILPTLQYTGYMYSESRV